MMSSPGDVRIESAIACAARRDVTGVAEMNLQDVSDKEYFRSCAMRTSAMRQPIRLP